MKNMKMKKEMLAVFAAVIMVVIVYGFEIFAYKVEIKS